jgi:hypothetical protein
MADPNYSSVSLLLHMDGANGSTTFTDNSPSPKTVTANGNAQVSTTQSKFGGASGYFDGAGDYLSIPDSADFDFGSGNFTIEFWIYFSTTGQTHLICGQADSFLSNGTIPFACSRTATNYIIFEAYSGSTNIITLQTTSTVTSSVWYHVAIVRNSNIFKLYLNGIEQQSATSSSALSNSTNPFSIGRLGLYNGFFFSGYIDDFRLTKGIARYTSNFTPPSQAFPNKAPDPEIYFEESGPLGNVNILSALEVQADITDFGPLGQPAVLSNNICGLISVPSILASASSLVFHLFGQVQVASPLGASNSLLNHDFTGQLGDATTYYVMELTTPGGTVRVPISSWQATLQTGLSNYVQCVVPAAQSYITQINAATQFKILRQVTLPNGFVVEYQMANGPVQTVTLNQGPFRYTAIIEGYSSGFAINETPDPAYNRTLQGLRSVSVSGGNVRVRSAIDWLLRPSQRVFAGDRNFVASYINYYVGNNDAYMEVGER